MHATLDRHTYHTYPVVHQGVLFICLNVDHRILYGELTEDVIQDGIQFYTTFFNAPPAIKVKGFAQEKKNAKFHDISQALLHGFVGIGVLGLLLKVARWDTSAKWFDGSSMGEFTPPMPLWLES